MRHLFFALFFAFFAPLAAHADAAAVVCRVSSWVGGEALPEQPVDMIVAGTKGCIVASKQFAIAGTAAAVRVSYHSACGEMTEGISIGIRSSQGVTSASPSSSVDDPRDPSFKRQRASLEDSSGPLVEQVAVRCELRN